MRLDVELDIRVEKRGSAEAFHIYLGQVKVAIIKEYPVFKGIPTDLTDFEEKWIIVDSTAQVDINPNSFHSFPAALSALLEQLQEGLSETADGQSRTSI